MLWTGKGQKERIRVKVGAEVNEFDLMLSEGRFGWYGLKQTREHQGSSGVLWIVTPWMRAKFEGFVDPYTDIG